MIKPRQTSVVILITLAELAWLAGLGLLFAYRGKVGELGALKRSYDEKVEAGATNVARLVEQLTEAEEAKRKVELAFEERKKAEAKALAELRLAASELAELKKKWEALPTDVGDLADRYRDASNELASARTQLGATGVQMVGLSNLIGQLEVGEVSIRRELTGLPTNELRRVVFIVDTSSSMHGSPAWDEARSLMRKWVEYLSVEECVLVNFNDNAVAFPSKGFHRVRDTNGTVLPAKRDELLAAFDKAQTGIYSDLLKGLKLAYGSDKPDLIVLFTDGHPHIATHTDPDYAGMILAEVSKHPGTPILTVAVGSYEVEGAGGPRERRNAAIAFLKELARKTGGSFLGR
jgi:hypothetical protein